MLAALAIAGFALSLAPPDLRTWPLLGLGLLALAWVGRRPNDVRRDDALPALAVLLAALGLLVIERISPALAQRQIVWLAISLGLAFACGPAFERFRRLAGFKYVWVLGSVILFVLLAAFGQEVNGAKLWIRVGPVQYEPIEIIKLFIVLFMAAYLAETGDVIAAAKPWSLRANARYLGPLFLGWGASMAISVFERDLGMATLLLATFAAMLYVATRRIDLIVGGAALFGAAVFWAVHHYAYVGARIAVWRSPFADPLGRGYQAVQGYFSLAAGGLFGTGYGLGHPRFIPDVATDYVFAAWSEEFGLIGALVLLAAFASIVWRALSRATRQPDVYAKLLATGLAATLGFQVVIIVGGVIGLFPLTGITLPFVSYGGSSLLANFLLIALVWAIGSERRDEPEVAERTSG
jgi:cell division protein FtsW (lipid II flippase)